MDIMDIIDIRDNMENMDIMDIMDLMDIIDIMIKPAWMDIAFAVLTLGWVCNITFFGIFCAILNILFSCPLLYCCLKILDH